MKTPTVKMKYVRNLVIHKKVGSHTNIKPMKNNIYNKFSIPDKEKLYFILKKKMANMG